jgi:hypothetical protein
MPYIGVVHAQKAAHSGTPRLDNERGRRDDRAQLSLHLAEAPSEYLDGALHNPELGPGELAILLRSRAATDAIVARVGRNGAWMRARALKIAFVANPRAPQILARRFLPHLSWRDLVDVAANLRLSPVLRREAEKLLKTRLPELSVGERVALARRGSRGIVEILREEAEPLVLRALAGNPRATESDFEHILVRDEVPAGFLGWLADQSTWSRRRSVRLAIIRHSRTPLSSALRLIRALSRRDLDDLSRDALAPRLIRVAAERVLSAADGAVSASRPQFG